MRDVLSGSAYRKTIGILLCLVGITALMRALMGLRTGMLHLWPMLPLSVGMTLMVLFFKYPKQRWGLLLAGWLVGSISLFLSLFTLDLLDWSDMVRLWPVFPCLIGLSCCLALNARSAGIILSIWLPGWVLIGGGVFFFLLTHRILPWRWWTYVPMISGVWFLSAQHRLGSSILWLVLGMVSFSVGFFCVPFAEGWLAWSSLHRYQSALFLLLGTAFMVAYDLRHRRERGLYSTAVILFALSGITLVGPLLVGWDRFGWNFWPILLMIVGIGLLILFGLDRKTWTVWIPGMILFLLGIFLCSFTMGLLPWTSIVYLWPTLPGIVGLSFMLAALRGGLSQMRTFFFVGLTLGVISLLLYLFALWPIGLLLAGLLFIWPFPRRNVTDPKPSGSVPSLSTETTEEGHPTEEQMTQSKI